MDSSDRIFATANGQEQLNIFAADGTLLMRVLLPTGICDLRLEKAEHFFLGDDLYGIDQLTGESLLHVSDNGDAVAIGSGFGNTYVTFGIDGALTC